MKRITISSPPDDARPPAKVAACRSRSKPSGADPARPAPTAKGRYVLNGQPIGAPALARGLHLVATPIGNLRDVTLRALEVLAAADLIACEDTRVTRKLLDHYGITTPLTPYHDHNAAEARPKLLGTAGRGRNGRAGVRCRHAAGLRSGLQAGARGARGRSRGDRAARRLRRCSPRSPSPACRPTAFFFEGFLPPKAGGSGAPASPSWRAFRRRWCCSRPARASPPRSPISPKASARREAAVCRELTKLYEEVRRGDLATLAGRLRRGRRNAARS